MEEFEATEPAFLGSHHVKFYGEYGCALLSTVIHANEMVNLVLVCLDGWEFQVHSSSSMRDHSAIAKPEDLQVMSEDLQVMSVGRLDLDKYTSFLERTDYFITRAAMIHGDGRSAASGSQGHQKTPAFVEAAMLDLLTEIEQERDMEEGETIPKGGFTDVGLHTGGRQRDTRIVAYLRYHSQDKKHCVFSLRYGDKTFDLGRKSQWLSLVSKDL